MTSPLRYMTLLTSRRLYTSFPPPHSPHPTTRKKVVVMALGSISWLDFIVSWFAFMIARHDFCISCFEINLGVVAESLWI